MSMEKRRASLFWRFFDGPLEGRWPRWLRRAFLLTAPVSFPLYVVAWIGLALDCLSREVGQHASEIRDGIATWAREMWRRP